LIVALAVGAAVLVACGSENEMRETVEEDPPAEVVPDRPKDDEPPPIGDGDGGVALESVGEFDQPLHVTQPPGDEAIYVVEQCGRVVRAPTGSGEPATFLDLSGSVTCGGEQGLLSVAFAPGYERSGRLYVDYTAGDESTRVVELRRSDDDPTVADPDSARELLAIEQPYPNHNGGLVLFGPDGNLYIGTGDGGSADDPLRAGQDLDTLLGKILRIDPRAGGGEPYRIPADNPFADGTGGRPEILAYGLRNPWRFSFDRETDELWIGDVGQNELEEVNGPIDDLGAGANFGWSAFEGTNRFNEDQRAPGAIDPALTYPTGSSGCSITGGHVVRDPRLESLYGRYLYGDFCSGELRSFIPGQPGSDRALGPEVPSLSSFGEDARGRIYVTSLEGDVHRLAPQ